MKALVLQAHPLRESYNEALLTSTVSALEASGIQTKVCRLYDGEEPVPADLASVEILTFVYPTWWGGLPAILLDWVQRCVGHALDSGGPSPLPNVRDVIIVTSHGSSKWVNLLQGEPGKHLLAQDVVRLCATDATAHWISLYKLDRRSPTELASFVGETRRRIRSITG